MTASPTRRFGAAVVFTSVFLLASISPVHAAEGSVEDGKPATPHKPREKASAETVPAAAPAPAVPAADQPRHGARKKTPDGTVVIYDRVSGTWRAPTLGEGYWFGDRYYRYDSGLWLTATVAAGPWQLVSADVVPDSAKRYAPPKDAVTAKLPSGVEAVFEPRLKVFKVAGHKGVFLFDALFYRVDSGLWLGSSSVDGPWAPVSPKPLPVPLRKAVGDPVEGQEVTLPTGEAVVWDAASKVFTLKERPSVVLHDGKFFEKRDDKWFESAQSSTGFEEKGVQEIPLAVRFKFRKEPADGAKAGRNGGKGAGRNPGKNGGKAARDKAAAGGAKAGKAGKAGNKTAAERREGKAAGANADGRKKADSADASGSESE